MPGWHATRLRDVPLVPPEEPGDFEWRPLQHHFRLTAFGANAYTAVAAGQELVDEHDERESGQEELYVVVAGSFRFELDGESVEASAPFVVAVPEPGVRRRATALEAGATLLAFGGKAQERFRSSWDARHFTAVPQA